MARFLMENAECAFFEPFITGVRGRGRGLASRHRQVPDGVFWIARTGSRWRIIRKSSANGRVSIANSGAGQSQAFGPDPRCAERNEATPDQVQMIRRPADVRMRVTKGDGAIARAHHQAAGEKAGLKDRVLAVQRVASQRRSI